VGPQRGGAGGRGWGGGQGGQGWPGEDQGPHPCNGRPADGRAGHTGCTRENIVTGLSQSKIFPGGMGVSISLGWLLSSPQAKSVASLISSQLTLPVFLHGGAQPLSKASLHWRPQASPKVGDWGGGQSSCRQASHTQQTFRLVPGSLVLLQNCITGGAWEHR
jgi:hypothetical protein